VFRLQLKWSRIFVHILEKKLRETRRKNELVAEDSQLVSQLVEMAELEPVEFKSGNVVMPKLQSEVPKLETEMPEMGSELPKLETEIPKLEAEIPKLETEIPKLETEILKLDSENFESCAFDNIFDF